MCLVEFNFKYEILLKKRLKAKIHAIMGILVVKSWLLNTIFHPKQSMFLKGKATSRFGTKKVQDELGKMCQK